MTAPIGALPRLPGLSEARPALGSSTFAVKSAAFTVLAGDRILADMTGGDWTMKLPAAARPGDSFELQTYGSSTLTIDRNGHAIAGTSDDGVIVGNTNVYTRMTYLNSTKGWVYGGAL